MTTFVISKARATSNELACLLEVGNHFEIEIENETEVETEVKVDV